MSFSHLMTSITYLGDLSTQMYTSKVLLSFLYTHIIFPISRNIGFGFSSVLARVGAAVGPQLVYLVFILHQSLPCVLYIENTR